ncbi:MAG TPA: ABC transporter permease [Candidatus Kapabacteria bacterium]|nr:ABC transporter permease [Candidatus Kapabacteria bacterium]
MTDTTDRSHGTGMGYDAPAMEEVREELIARASVPPRLTKEESERRKSENESVLQQQAHSLWYYSWRRLRRNRLAMAGLIITILLIFTAVFASDLAPFDPNMQVLEYSTEPIGFQGNVLLAKSEVDPSQTVPIPIVEYHVRGDRVNYTSVEGRDRSIIISQLAGISESDWHKTPTYYFGTDRYGRDVLSRLMYGARVSLTVAFFAEMCSLVIGILLGSIAGFYRGKVDDGVMWFTNVVWSIPSLLLIIAISIALGLGMWQTIIAIGITEWVDMARIVRGQFFALRETEYVEATKALGLSNKRTIFRHILPNSLGPIIVIATAGFANAIIYEASLSFLGLGVQPPTSTWGQMIHDGYGFIAAGSNWGLTLFPAFAIMMAVFAFNLFGDGLRDAFDPKMKR